MKSIISTISVLSIIVLVPVLLALNITNRVGRFAERNLIVPELSDSYFKKWGKIYYCQGGQWFNLGYTKCDSDVESFQVLGRTLAKDKNSIFCVGTIQRHVDYQSFVVTSERVVRDKYNAYPSKSYTDLEPVKIEGMDLATFDFVEGSRGKYGRWAKDKNYYYRNNEKLDVHYDSFHFLSNQFFYDKDNLFADLNLSGIQHVRRINKIPTKLNDEYVVYDDTIYYVNKFVSRNKRNSPKLCSVEIIDRINTFKSVSDHVICVNGKILFYGEYFSGPDVKTFELIRNGNYPFARQDRYYKDKDHVYLNKQKIELADPATFTLLTFDYSKDKNYVFYKHGLLEGADAKSFRIDKNFRYHIDDNGNKYGYDGEKL